ncbi:MAG TPA: cache domain-containing protein [Thermoanaerobaculia bacterium]|nr:cache domain-containing protein [Thermoanaerobaculia bacterium]
MLDRAKLPILAFLIVVGLGAAYYFLHVEPRREYLTELEVRRLHAIAERIDAQLTTYRQVVGNGGTSPRFERVELKDAKAEKAAKAAKAESDRQQPAGLATDIQPDGRWFRLDSPSLRVYIRAGDLVERAVEKSSSFDRLILVDAKEGILHQTGRSDVKLGTLGALEGLSQEAMKRLHLSTGVYHDVRISGRSYDLFVQPLQENLMLCGLALSQGLRAESFKIPADWIILLSGMILIGLLAMPFLKLVTIGKQERLRAIDGLLAALCTLIGLSALTILLLDWVVYNQLNQEADGQLELLAEKIHEDFKGDLSDSLAELDAVHGRALKLEAVAKLPAETSVAGLGDHVDFFWASSDGMQQFKWTAPGQESPRISVRDRRYFQDAAAGRWLVAKGSDGKVHRFTFQPVRSWTTGEDMVEIAGSLQDSAGQPVVAVLSTTLASIHRPVLPPGFGFAVIDPQGDVLFHSEPMRALQENFFEETDNPELQALLFSDRSGLVKVRYMGRQHQVYLAPVEGLPWTIVTFRDLTLLRVVHVQIVTVALACLTLYAGLFLVLFICVYLTSSTRARWLWPSTSRRGTYLQLAAVYIGCLLAYAVPLFAGDPVFLLFNGMLVPLLVLFVSYVKVRSDERLWDDKQKVAVAVSLILLALATAIGISRLGREVRVFSILALVVGGLFLFLPAVTRFFGRRSLVPTREAYLVCAALLLMVLTVLPAASFFKMARDLPLENLVKHGQLRLLQQLEKPGMRPLPAVARGSAEPAALRSGHLRGDYSSVFFSTTHSLEICDRLRCVTKRKKAPHLMWLVELQEGVFPIYSEHSREMARLALDNFEKADKVRGWPWVWNHQKQLSESTGREEEGVRLHGRRDSDGYATHLSSTLPPLGLDRTALRRLAAGLAALALVSMVVIWFLGRNLLLVAADSPLWISSRRFSIGALGGNQIRVSSRPVDLRVPNQPQAAVIDLAEQGFEVGQALASPELADKRLVFVRRFEHRLGDPGSNQAKLQLLEALTDDGDRQVIVLSTQDPHLCLVSGTLCGDTEADEDERQRWSRVLARFATIDLGGRPEDSKALEESLKNARESLLQGKRRSWIERFAWERHVDRCLGLIRRECSPTVPLQAIGRDLLSDLGAEEMDPERLLDEIRRLAEAYYETLWKSLPESEKVVLLQLAEEGLVNPRNIPPLERLMARGLVRCDKAPRLMNESFRCHVIGAVSKDAVSKIERASGQQSLWGQLQKPLYGTLVGLVLFFGFTQKEVLDSTITLVTLVAGVLPQVLKLVGFVGLSKSGDTPGG